MLQLHTLRLLERGNDSGGTPCPIDVDACAAEATRIGAEVSRATLVGHVLSALPAGVRELSLADLLADFGDFAAAIEPAWPVERGRKAVLQCALALAGRAPRPQRSP